MEQQGGGQGGSQQHILGFATNLYNYILVKKNICN
jgi:hypothetical protein